MCKEVCERLTPRRKRADGETWAAVGVGFYEVLALGRWWTRLPRRAESQGQNEKKNSEATREESGGGEARVHRP